MTSPKTQQENVSNKAYRAYKDLLPNHKERRITLTYSGRFKHYNANVSMRGDEIHFKLSKEWEGVAEEIQTGLIQHLLCKLFRVNKTTTEINLYNTFLKQMSRLAPSKQADPLLTHVFEELNQEYFAGMMEKPNLVFGKPSLTTLGHYHYASDTVTISSALKNEPSLLRYVLYHELLHKKHTFTVKGTKTHHHTKAFREDEKKFKDNEAEKKLEAFLRKQKQARNTRTRKKAKPSFWQRLLR